MLGRSCLRHPWPINPPRSLPCTHPRLHRPPPSPLGPPWWACFSACSPARPSPWSPSQASTIASPITYGLALPSHSVGTSPPWRYRRCLAAGHHRAVPRPSRRQQSTPSESNRTPCSLICLPGPYLATGERATAIEYGWGRPRAHLWILESCRGLCASSFFTPWVF
jgi:hypothetical protein